MTDKATAARAAVLRYALSLPEAFEDHPWGESVAKVGSSKKIFVFLGVAKPRELVLCVKLTESGADALALPFAKPAGYGLGKHGWVHMTFGVKDLPPRELLESWVLESYRAVAPKSLARRAGEAPAAASGPTKRRATSRSRSRRASSRSSARSR
jgi:predicted DNA-binding protein (MmcQ/YjbR family)